ncbi:MAG: 4-diphosphocytidyl-2-C-methyl-D-erythritol kinase [uncultured Sphingomonas sp.]|uniref:4-diphosphocytidyl-2-C-methyl-D-erythritol kinase n=1 Tax=uncultured Sphingomonas sp. TaxID=158754 RepID=A0A6J4TCU9_9SPHN|nr:4-(cytidine 5'-diphospho)-2-C-methyl-D-erythritol kinase [uncultured Sphingomonas sp.]CAA9519775.1 MAG: 4-diphosphocytidyl-2-C-methyl-D-erythritol kinase [uncultured Sphingomonas sp.]
MRAEAGRWSELAPAKLNLALHVRGRLPDGRHALETLFAFCIDGDRLSGEPADEISLAVTGPFADALGSREDNLVLRAARALKERAGASQGAALTLHKALPIASGIGGGSADAAAALRLLTGMWKLDPAHASAVAPKLGSDVPACLLGMTCHGSGAGDELELADEVGVAGAPALLVNPRVPLSTGEVFARWDGVDRGPLDDDWRGGRNDLELPARGLVPQIGDVLDWLVARNGITLARMSGSGATCFALFEGEQARDEAADACPAEWWHLATALR